jgi:hypothetical protein
MTPPGILPSPLRDKVGYSNHDRFRGHIPVHCCSGLQPPCLRFAMAVTGHHARLGTRLLARLCRGRHSRRLGYMRFQGATRTDPYVRLSRIRLPPRVCDGKTFRMRSSACDTLIRLCVRRVLCWPAFPSVPALRSTNSAADHSALFVGFPATMARSDFSGPYTSATAPHLPDAGRQRQRRSGQTRDLPASDAIPLHVMWP